jgi:hypothetical protein
MNIEKLVPPLEMCEKIPEDEFLDTAFCWHYTEVAGFACGTSGCRQISGKQWQLERSTSGKIVRYRQRGEVIFPAPVLEEVMAAMPYCRVYKKTAGMFIAVHEKTRVNHMDGATAALKLWLKLKGVENE